MCYFPVDQNTLAIEWGHTVGEVVGDIVGATEVGAPVLRDPAPVRQTVLSIRTIACSWQHDRNVSVLPNLRAIQNHTRDG